MPYWGNSWRPGVSEGQKHPTVCGPAPDLPSSDPATGAAALPNPALTGISDLRAVVHDYERSILIAALERCRHNQRRTATALALTYDQLRHALKRHDMLNAGA
jgi:psp operon transcriptional activator